MGIECSCLDYQSDGNIQNEKYITLVTFNSNIDYKDIDRNFEEYNVNLKSYQNFVLS